MKNALLALLALMFIAPPAMAGGTPCQMFAGYFRCNGGNQALWVPNSGLYWNPSEGGTSWTIQQSTNGHTILISGLGWSDTGNGNADWYLARLEPVDTETAPNVYTSTSTIQCIGGQGLSSPNYLAPNCVLTGKSISLTLESTTAGTLVYGTRTSHVENYVNF